MWCTIDCATQESTAVPLWLCFVRVFLPHPMCERSRVFAGFIHPADQRER